MSREIDDWFAAAGPREEDLRRVDALVQAAAPGIDRQRVPMGSGAVLGTWPRPGPPAAGGADVGRRPWPRRTGLPQAG